MARPVQNAVSAVTSADRNADPYVLSRAASVKMLAPWLQDAHLLFVDDEPALRSLMAERLASAASKSSRLTAAKGPSSCSINSPSTSSSPTSGCLASTAPGSSKPPCERYPGIVGIVITGYGTMKDAVDAIKRGASDFIAKPFQFDELMHVLQKAIEQRRLKSENAYLRSQLEERYQFGGILGRSRPMQALFQLLETVARVDAARFSSPAKPAREKKSWRAPFITAARGAHIASSRSTAARFPKRCSRRSCSATFAARSRARSARGRGASSRRTRERCFSTKSAR